MNSVGVGSGLPLSRWRNEPMPLNCPKCETATEQHPDPSYYGEMRQCPACGFIAYFDAWGEDGAYNPALEPF